MLMMSNIQRASCGALQPTTLSIGNAAAGPAGIAQVQQLKSLPAQFDAAGLVEEQFEATSADGTKVPYFLVRHRDMPFDGSTPTLLYGYGGFEISLTPSYAAAVGATWLTNNTHPRTGQPQRACYVMANIRGGGEFGPAWHQAALKENRKRAYDDFIAVAEDLIARNITSSQRLGKRRSDSRSPAMMFMVLIVVMMVVLHCFYGAGIRGGSNGGLLMGNMMTRRPDLFGAVCCAVPLLDMRCFHTLLAGASWTAEYGNPEVDEVTHTVHQQLID